MIEETDFETFLYISKNKYQIFVYDKNNLKNLYNAEVNFDEEVEFNSLSKFLDENIYKIEKKVNNFIKDIILIIDDQKILSINISIKKKNYQKYKNQKYLENNLKEIKDIFRENYKNQIIMHMIIVNNDSIENNFLSNSLNTNDENIYIEVNFISISNSFTMIFDKLLEIHQIRIKQFMSANYTKSFFGEDPAELPKIATQLNNGLNQNEVILVSKPTRNKGFFEKFFQLFS